MAEGLNSFSTWYGSVPAGTIIAVVFLLQVLMSCGVASLIGGWEGKWIALLYLCAFGATRLVWFEPDVWRDQYHIIGWIDASLLIGLYMVALRSNRWWPIWITGLHLLTVLSHLQAALAPAFAGRVFFALEVFWAPIKMVVLLLGALVDRRADHDPAPRRRRYASRR